MRRPLGELLLEVMESGADLGLTDSERLRRFAGSVRRELGADRAWIVATHRVDGCWMARPLAEDSDLRFPGVLACGEPGEAMELASQLARLLPLEEPLRLRPPFRELAESGRSLLRRFNVVATVVAAAKAPDSDVFWVVALDYCMFPPRWSQRDHAVLGKLTRALAMLARSALLFARVEHAKRELELLFDTQPDGVAMVDPEGYVVRCNRAYARIRGAETPARALGLEAACTLAERCGEEGCALTLARRGGMARAVVREEHPEGVRWRECAVQAVAGGAGLFLHVVRDVTEQKALSERAAQQARLESLGTLAGGVAHEFNNILMGMRPAVERLHRSTPGDMDAIRQLDAALDRAGHLSRRMLALSRQRTGLEARSGLGAVLDEIIQVLRSTLPRNIRIEALIAPELGAVALDATAVHSIFLNLATNARDAMPGGGELHIVARRSTIGRVPRIVVEVRDSGHGIRAADLPRIFDPFFSTKGPDGTGLGLAVVHRLVSEAGGTVTVESDTDGSGTTFTITLPVVGAEEAPRSSYAPATHTGLDGLRVLLVDDEALILEGVTYFLREAGAEVVACESAEEALAEFADSPDSFDAVVVDYGLPGLDGCALLGQLLDIRPRLIAVLVSGYTETQRFSALRLQGVRFFQKPFRVTELITHLADRV